MAINSQSIADSGVGVSSLVELLRQRGVYESGGVAYRFLADGETDELILTYGDLYRRARAVAALLQDARAQGQRALLLYPSGADYVAAFFGCLLAGVVAVPAYPPRLNRNAARLETMAQDAGASVALTNSHILSRLASFTQHTPAFKRLRWLATDTIDGALAEAWREPSIDGRDLAYLQYTSGSTSAPKGVMVTHANVLHNSAYIHQGFAHTPESVSLTWLPHFHDMGLLDGIIQPVYGGFTGIIMSPTAFLQRPARWLEAVTRYRVTHTGGPNFAYDLCARRTTGEVRATLDLGSWSVAYNGAEPVSAETLRRFAGYFAPCGFRSEAFYPAYGLAEATLKVSGGRRGVGPTVCTIDAGALEQNRVVETSAHDDDGRALVSSGQATFETEVLIVNPETLVECGPEDVGEIWVRGPGVAAGYWNRPAETERVFQARLASGGAGAYLRTGDLGFLRRGELYVTGRLKDLIIIRGRNLYPQDIEAAVGRCDASLRPAGGAAFSVETDGAERLVVVQEIEPRAQFDPSALLDAIRRTLAEEFEVQPFAVLLVKAGSVPKTSSGKIQRNSCRRKFLSRELETVAEWHARADLEMELDAGPDTLAPSNADDIETWLRARLAGMLRVDGAGIDAAQPVTHYGVDSLMAVELMHGLETGLGVVLPLSDFFQSPSLAEIARRALDEYKANESRAAREAALSSTAQEASLSATREAASTLSETNLHPLSHGQRALWFLSQVAPESAAYNVAAAVRIKSALDVAALRRVFQKLVDRHAALRTTFKASPQGEPSQVIQERTEVAFSLEDAKDSDESFLKQRLGEESHRPFDLESGPLFRVHLFRQGEASQVLLIVAHHINVDFWSLALLMQEMGELYRAGAEGATPALAPLAADYAEYVRRQHDLLEGDAGARLADFWHQELADAPPVLDLHADRPRPAKQIYNGASEPLRFDAGLTRQLKDLSREQNATPYTTLLAAFQTLLYRYTGQEDLLVGSPTSGRNSARFARTVGYFVNPVVLRSHPAGDSSFIEFLQQVRRTVLDAFAHDEYPFDLLVKRLQPERDPARSPLFQVMFAFNQAHRLREEGLAAFALGEEGARMELGGLALESVRLEQRVAQFDLALTVAEVGDELAASLEYNSDLFDAATVRRVLEHLRTLLEAIVARPSTPLARLDMLTPAERRQLLDGWNASSLRDDARVLPVQQLFEQHAASAPESVAVVWEDRRVSYGELNERANYLAHYLRARGVGADVPVAICLERSIEIVVAMFGVLKAGGAYVPVDPSYPSERIASMLADVRAPVLITQQSLVERLSAGAARVVRLDADAQEIERERAGNPDAPPFTNQLAYIIYTSGSTGQPKGVMVAHQSLSEAYRAWREAYRLDAVRSVLQMANFSFDVFTEDAVRALCTGARLVLCPKDFLFAPEELYELMQREEIDFADFVPAVLRALVQHLEQAGRRLEYPRTLVSGADALYVEDLRRLQRLRGDDTRLLNSFGITEATIDNTIFEDTAATTLPPEGIVPIGRPFANVKTYVLDRRLEPVPVGVAGELYIGGSCVARGYLNRAELTAERFIPDPFGKDAGARLYRTGDLARYLPGGQIEFLGRNDYQVKVRGYRVELGEIEATLLKHPQLTGALVVAAGERTGLQSLVAYVVAASQESAPNAQELRAFLKERLAEQMIPSAFVLLERLPLTPNGKVDRRALPDAPALSRVESEQSYAAPRTQAEKILCDIWAALLQLESVGIHDNFFESGGDSIMSIQVVARAKQAGINLTPGQIFEHPTIAQLAAASSANQASPVVAQGRPAGAVKLTPIQRWFFEQEFAAPDHWNMSLMLEAKERLDPALLEKTLAHLVEHHDALRLRFVKAGATWQQSIAAETKTGWAVSVVDLSGLSSDERRTTRARVTGEIQSQLNLASGPLARVALFEEGAQSAQHLLLAIHHLAVDVVSIGILLEDFERVYRQLQDGRRVELPFKTTSFQYWAERLEQFAQGDELRRELDYWSELSARAPAPLPSDASGENTEGSTLTHTVALTVQETRSLFCEAMAACHTQVNDLLLASLARAFRLWTKAETLLVELEGHGREELFAGVDLSRTVGWFTSAFPVLLDLEGADAPGAALKTIKEELRRVPRHGVGYGLLRYAPARPEVVERMRALPHPQVSFNYLGRLEQMWLNSTLFRRSGHPAGTRRHARAKRDHLIEIDASVVNQELRIEWTFSREIHRRETVERLAADHVAALRELIALCLANQSSLYTPSDFPLAKLDGQRLDELLAETEGVEDVYRLSPTQQGMLFHSLYAPDAAVYTGQFGCTLRGELDVDAFAAAWQEAVDRNEILRASFVWENLAEPLQLIRRRVDLPLERHDWRALPFAEQARRWESLLEEERRRGFDLSASPLLRPVLARVADDSHRFVLTSHHLLLDGWSGALLLREVFDAYEAARKGEPLRAGRRRPYRDFIAWLEQQDNTRAEAFWRKYLEGFSAPTPLMIERPHHADGGELQEFGETKLRLSTETTARLQAFARQHQLTLNTLVQGAWAALLSRYSQEQDVVFGTTIAGRPASLAGVESMVGLFINTLPVRVRVQPDARLLAWLKRLQNEQARLREYEHSPLVEIQRWSDAPRDVQLFESLLVFENYPADASALSADLSLKLDEVRSFDRTNYPLTIVAVPGRELTLEVLYDGQRFDAEAVARLLAHMQTLLEDFMREPQQTLGTVQLLTVRERRQLLREWSGAASSINASPRLSIHELFEAQAARTPAAVAWVCEGERLTYRELNERANRLAHRLQALGVGPESLVGILLHRSTPMMVALLGVLKAGGAYLALDPLYPQERVAYMLADADASVVLTESGLRERLSAHDAHVLSLDTDEQTFADASAENPQSRVAPDNVAYVIYTSGSTGQPKGVQITHANASAFIEWAAEQFSAQELSVVLAVTSICFDLSIFELFVTLGVGGKVVMSTNALSLPDLAAEEVTLINTVPSALAELLRIGALPASVRTVNLAGEPLKLSLVKQAYQLAGVERVLNLYGPTEDTTYSTFALIKRDAQGEPTIGRPVKGTEVYLLDGQGQPVPQGAIGEIYIGGAGLARGYLGRPELTAEKFVPHPFSAQAGARLYRTGDLARFNPEGEIEFLGRADHQVKIRGIRIELGEIEACLSGHAEIREAVVVAREDGQGDKRLAAYLVAKGGATPAVEALRGYLKTRLPDYMIPSAYVWLDELPLTPNGKIDRKALPAPDSARHLQGEAYVAPRNAVEEALTGIWTELLGVERIGVNDSFFDLGGHSLLATRLLSTLRQVFGLELTLREVFEATTVVNLAALLDARERTPGRVEKIARVWLKIKRASPDELKHELQRKRQEKSGL